MSITKNQHLRLDILDQLLASKKWTLEELLSRMNRSLEDHDISINRRTLFRDVKHLIENENAPIHRPKKNDNLYYYTEDFSRKNIPIDQDDIATLKNAIQILKGVDNFQLMDDVDGVIKRLENKIHISAPDAAEVIQFEKHTYSKGHDYFSDLQEAIQSKVALRLWYQPYSQLQPTEQIVHPYLLKEFRNRWFLFARENKAMRITIYALDRIKKLQLSKEPFTENNLFDPKEYFKHLIGVSIPEGAKPQKIEIKVYPQSVPYVLSKPIHLNQEIIKRFKDGSILITLDLIINYELKSILLSYMDGIEVKKPLKLRADMKSIISGLSKLY